MSTRTDQTIERAIEVFARGFTFTRSMTHPFLAERVGPVWVMRDGPRTRKGEHYRTEEWIAYGVEPAEVDRIARRDTRGKYAICAIHGIDESPDAMRAEYKRMGYRLGTSEPLFVHRLKKIPRVAPPDGIFIERVTTPEVADQLAKAARARQILHEQLNDDAPVRQYAARTPDGAIIGWAQSTLIPDCHATWCGSMYVEPEFRRRGIARALLARILKDDRSRGATASVLLASHAGALLYPVVGYEQIGVLLLYVPGKKR